MSVFIEIIDLIVTVGVNNHVNIEDRHFTDALVDVFEPDLITEHDARVAERRDFRPYKMNAKSAVFCHWDGFEWQIMGVFNGAYRLSVALPSGFYSSSESTILVRLVQRYNTRRANRDYNQFLMPKPELFGVPIFPLPCDQQITAMHNGVWPHAADLSIQQFGRIASYL